MVKPNLNVARKSGPLTPSSETPEGPGPSCHVSSPAEGWIFPKKTSKTNSAAYSPQQLIEPEKNRFQSLDSENVMDQDLEDQDISGPAISVNRKFAKPPPINTLESSINNLIKVATSLSITKSDFLIKETDSGAHSIYVNSLEHHKLICDKLLELKIQFYTYTPKHLKPKSIVLKGIRGSFEPDDIKLEILDLHLPDVEIISLTKFIFNKTQPDRYHFLVQLSSKSKTVELFKIKTLAYQRVKWEHLKKMDLFQCKNCQRLGHASKNCHLPYRCVKCAQSHSPGACAIGSTDNRSSLKCANCNMAGHPASYKGCPFLKFAAAKKQEHKILKQRTSLKKISNISSTIRGSVSYAQAASTTMPHPLAAKPRIPAPTHRFETPLPPPLGNGNQRPQDHTDIFTPPQWVNKLMEDNYCGRDESIPVTCKTNSNEYH